MEQVFSNFNKISKRSPHLLKLRRLSKMAELLKWSSSVFALAGGILVASKTEVTQYGFIFLALSSGQLLLASVISNDRPMSVYSVSVFMFVDCLGIYRWLLS